MITRSDLSLASVRLLGLYLVARSLGTVPSLLAGWDFYFELDSEVRPNLLWLGIAVVIPLPIGILVVLLGRPISRWVLPRSDEPLESTSGSTQFQSIVIGTFGLFLIAATLPDLLVSPLAVSVRNEANGTSRHLLQDPRFWKNLLSVGIGTVLITGAAFWSRLIARFRGSVQE